MKLDELEAVLSTAERYTLRTTFDSSDVESAIVILENALEVALNNAPIYFAGGNIDQWSLCMMNATQFKEAIYFLKNRGGLVFDSTELSPIDRVKLVGEATALLQEKNIATDPMRKIQIAKRLSEIVVLLWGDVQENRQYSKGQQFALVNPNDLNAIQCATSEMMSAFDSTDDKQRVLSLERRLQGGFIVDTNYNGFNSDGALQELTSKSLINGIGTPTHDELSEFAAQTRKRRDVLFRAASEYALLRAGAPDDGKDESSVQIKRIAENVLSDDQYLEYARVNDAFSTFSAQYVKAHENSEDVNGIMVDYLGENISLRLAVSLTLAQRIKLYDSIKGEYERKVKQSPMYLELEQEAKQLERETYSTASNAIEALNNVSGITVEQSKDWVKSNTSVSKSAKARLTKQGYTQEALESDMAEFYRLTGGKISKVSIETNGSRRAHTSGSLGKYVAKINVDSDFSRVVLWHEMGHHLEKDPKASALAYAFLMKRRESEKLHTLRSLTGSKFYKPNEVAFKDSWISPYIGKFYEHGTTEVFSMAMQWLSSPKDCQALIAQDKELFDMVTGYLQSERDGVCKFGLDIMKSRDDLKKSEEESAASELQKLTSGIEYDIKGQDEIGRILDDNFKTVRRAVEYRSRNGSKIEYLGIFDLDESFSSVVAYGTFKDYLRGNGYKKRYLLQSFLRDGGVAGHKTFDSESELKAWVKGAKTSANN